MGHIEDILSPLPPLFFKTLLFDLLVLGFLFGLKLNFLKGPILSLVLRGQSVNKLLRHDSVKRN